MQLAEDIKDVSGFFEPAEWRKLGMEYFDIASPLLPKMWRIRQDQPWTYVLSPRTHHPVQGWKIHISATNSSAKRILARVVELCVPQNVEFKFASDSETLRGLLSKLCTRSASGKFITIYPNDEQCFHSMLESLYDALKDEDGPYILSDRRYKDSKVIFYRYGGYQAFSRINNLGHRKSLIIDNNFKYIEDIRSPKFHLPDFVSDKHEPSKLARVVDNSNNFFCNGKYEIRTAIRISNAGGVYKGVENATGKEIILKEARPYIGIDRNGVDSIARLKKEHRILHRLAGTGIAPEPFTFFQEWEHFFFAQEFLHGETLRSFALRRNRIIHNGSSRDELNSWFQEIIILSINLLKLVHKLHGHKVIFGDLSPNNIMVNQDTMAMRLIDFEGAIEIGVDSDVNMWTPGFASMERQSRHFIQIKDDYFALGCVLSSLILSLNTMINLQKDVISTMLNELQKDFGIPHCFVDVVNELLSGHSRPLGELATLLETSQTVLNDEISPARPKLDDEFRKKTIDNILKFHDWAFTRRRGDRMFPAGPSLSHPLAIDHGALGVAYAWQKIHKQVPEKVTREIVNNFNLQNSLPGFFNGSSGMAWVMLEMGLEIEGKAALRHAEMHPTLFHSMTLGTGVSGYGLANLRYWQKTNEERYLDKALAIADILCETRIQLDDTCHWEDPTGETDQRVGLMEGTSGIALFLLYTYCVTGRREYLSIGEAALAFDLSFGKESHGSFGFPELRTGSNIFYPYLARGSAGIGTVVLRYFYITKEFKYLEIIEKIKSAVTQKYSISPGLFTGIAGMCNYLLDAAEFLKDDQYRTLAGQCAEGLKLFEIKHHSGSAFPAEGLMHISTDYSEGSSGIALLLHRIQHSMPNFNFMLDEMIYNAK